MRCIYTDRPSYEVSGTVYCWSLPQLCQSFATTNLMTFCFQCWEFNHLLLRSYLKVVLKWTDCFKHSQTVRYLITSVLKLNIHSLLIMSVSKKREAWRNPKNQLDGICKLEHFWMDQHFSCCHPPPLVFLLLGAAHAFPHLTDSPYPEKLISLKITCPVFQSLLSRELSGGSAICQHPACLHRSHLTQ